MFMQEDTETGHDARLNLRFEQFGMFWLKAIGGKGAVS